ncbi:MAG: hypothetical protein JWR33_223 [Naasia sp.]|jgi:hypothetical protein|nr:hypothetical protein [Naasia sp.]
MSGRELGMGDVSTATGSLYIVPMDPMDLLMCDSCQ